MLEGDPQGWYCHIAIHPVDDAVLRGYCAWSGLAHSRITRVPGAWLYMEQPTLQAADTNSSATNLPHGFFAD